MTKWRIRAIIGENIRNNRIARDISIDELAELMGLTAGFVGLIERGHRGTTPYNLLKLSEVFGVSIDSFFYSAEASSLKLGEEYASKGDIKRKKAESLISGFSDKELDFVISMLKGIRTLNRTQNADDDDDEEVYLDE